MGHIFLNSGVSPSTRFPTTEKTVRNSLIRRTDDGVPGSKRNVKDGKPKNLKRYEIPYTTEKVSGNHNSLVVPRKTRRHNKVKVW